MVATTRRRSIRLENDVKEKKSAVSALRVEQNTTQITKQFRTVKTSSRRRQISLKQEQMDERGTSTDLIYTYPQKLITGTVVDRPNRFVMNVILDENTDERKLAESSRGDWKLSRKKTKPTPVRCHCPNTGRISSIEFSGERVLVLDCGERDTAKTRYTVEAFALKDDLGPVPKWIGINQNRSNRIMECLLKGNALEALVGGMVTSVRREVMVADSSCRFDFLVNGDHLLEVKTPTGFLLHPLKNDFRDGKNTSTMFVSQLSDRLITHHQELARLITKSQQPKERGTDSERPEKRDAVGNKKTVRHGNSKKMVGKTSSRIVRTPIRRASVVLMFLYDGEIFQGPDPDPSTDFGKRLAYVRQQVRAAQEVGVRSWQVNVALSSEGARLVSYRPLGQWRTGDK
eukprot:Clim_evm48s7 gene=Clim_evmTU48s7